MICPFCREKDTSVVDSRPTEDGTAIRRRRVCTCNGGMRFTTFERVQIRELTVIKKNGRRTPFDREKLAKSFFTALKKRPIDQETIEKVRNDIGADILAYNAAENLANAVGIPTDSMCFTCSTGNYEPLGIAPTFKSRKEMKGD